MKNLSSKTRRFFADIDFVYLASLILLAMAILLGGGGADGALNNGIIYAASMVVIALAIAAHFTGVRPFSRWTLLAVGLFLLVFLLGIFQLTPVLDGPWLPSDGRAAERNLLELLGGDVARPLSLDTEATLRALASFLLPLALLLTGLSATRSQMRGYFIVVASGIVINGVFAILQIGLGYPEHLTLYADRQVGEATGLFANPNHFGLFLSLSILSIAVLALFLGREDTKRPAKIGGRRLHITVKSPAHGVSLFALFIAIPLFATFMFAADTRAGLFNLLIVVPIAIIVALRLKFSGKLLLALLAMPIIFGILIYLQPNFSFATRSGLLFDLNDVRFSIIPDLTFLLSSNWPWGIGLGSFESAFMSIENLDLVGPYYINHAHNDWLEWLIETGLPGAVILALALALLMAMAIRSIIIAKTNSRTARLFVWVSLGALAVTSIHSLVDYPVRMAANAAVLTVFVCLMALPWHTTRVIHRRSSRLVTVIVFAALLVPSLVASAVILQTFAAQQAFRDGRTAAAIALRPTHGAALALAAARIDPEEGNGADRAIVFGRQALIQRPLSIRGARAVALALEAKGDELNGFWPYAASLGWRDGPTQGWAFMQALRAGQYDIAAIRADALLRTGREIGEANNALWQLTVTDEFRQPFLKRLEREPEWRSNWLAAGPPNQEQALAGAQLLLSDLLPNSDRYEFSGTIDQLVKVGRPVEAFNLYRKVWPNDGDTLLEDGGFDLDPDVYRGKLTRFDWSLNRGTQGMATTVEGTGNQALFMESDGRARRVMVNRLIGIEPGRYELSFAVDRARGDTEQLKAAIACYGADTVLALKALNDLENTRLSLEFDVNGDCPIVMFTIVADLADDWVSATIDDVTLLKADDS